MAKEYTYIHEKLEKGVMYGKSNSRLYALSSTGHVYCMIFQFAFSLIGAGLTVMSLALLILV